MFDLLSDAAVVADVATERVVAVNPAAERLLGYAAAEARDLTTAQLLPRRLRADHRARLAQFRQTGHSALLEARAPAEGVVRAKSGAEVPVEVTLARLGAGADGTCHVVALLRDVAERARSVAALHAREAQLRAEVARHAALLRAACRLAVEADADRVCRALLDEAVALFGAGRGELDLWDASRGGLVRAHTHPAEPAEGGTLAEPGAAGRRAIRTRRAVVVHPRGRRGGDVPRADANPAGTTAAAPLTHDGRVLGALSVAGVAAGGRSAEQDLAALELLARLGAATLVGLERARLQAVQLAARTASHEINNRLALTCGLAELLAHDPALPPRLRQVAERVLEEGVRAGEVLERLQHLSRVEERNWGPGLKPTIDLARSAAPGAAQP